MGKIILDSVKLPMIFTEFILKAPQSNLESIALKIQSFLSEPEHKIPIGGYFAQCTIIKPVLIKNIVAYRCERLVTKIKNKKEIELKKLNASILEEIIKRGLSSVTISLNSAEFLIHNKLYRFVYHAPAKAIVLKYINKKPIGKLQLFEVEALTCKEGDLSFAAPSHCTKVYKEIWECK